MSQNILIWWDTIMCIHINKWTNMPPWTGTDTVGYVQSVRVTCIYMKIVCSYIYICIEQHFIYIFTLRSANSLITVFWDVTLCGLEDNCYIFLPVFIVLSFRQRQEVKDCYLSSIPYGITSQKMVTLILTTIRMSEIVANFHSSEQIVFRK